MPFPRRPNERWRSNIRGRNQTRLVGLIRVSANQHERVTEFVNVVDCPRQDGSEPRAGAGDRRTKGGRGVPRRSWDVKLLPCRTAKPQAPNVDDQKPAFQVWQPSRYLPSIVCSHESWKCNFTSQYVLLRNLRRSRRLVSSSLPQVHGQRVDGKTGSPL
jgi:hypothetical protein